MQLKDYKAVAKDMFKRSSYTDLVQQLPGDHQVDMFQSM